MIRCLRGRFFLKQFLDQMLDSLPCLFRLGTARTWDRLIRHYGVLNWRDRLFYGHYLSILYRYLAKLRWRRHILSLRCIFRFFSMSLLLLLLRFCFLLFQNIEYGVLFSICREPLDGSQCCVLDIRLIILVSEHSLMMHQYFRRESLKDPVML